MEFKNEGSARLDHLTITIFVLFGEGYFESEDSIFLRHGYLMSAKKYEDEKMEVAYS
jgi:hypothetical protein